MDKAIKINLAGILFQIEAEAYYMLRDYLQAIERHFKNIAGGNETIEDIESRIAEIFSTQQNTAGIISKENVEAMMGILGNPADFEQPGGQQERPYEAAARRRLYRNPDDSIVAGVCGGIGAYVDMDSVWIRIIFILLTIFFGIGVIIYLALWIALQKAISENQKKELYGSSYSASAYSSGRYNTGNSGASHSSSQVNDGLNRIGNAFDEVFRVLGNFFFVFFRIIMIIAGVVFVVAGFTLIVTFVMGFFFKYPGLISIGSLNTNLLYVPDLINCVVNPVMTPWIMTLMLIAVVLPLAALVYWGIKMIFWFRARDGVLSLIFLVIWVMSITALSIILFNEGISFSQIGRTSLQEIFPTSPDTLHIILDRKVRDLSFKKEFSLPDNHYTVFFGDSGNNLSVSARLKLITTTDKYPKVEIRKSSFSYSRTEAAKKAESLIYNYKICNDTILLDEYFTIPSGTKWAADEVTVNLYLPEKTILYFEGASGNMLSDRVIISKDDDENIIDSTTGFKTEQWKIRNKYWIITENGLKEVERAKTKQK